MCEREREREREREGGRGREGERERMDGWMDGWTGSAKIAFVRKKSNFNLLIQM